MDERTSGDFEGLLESITQVDEASEDLAWKPWKKKDVEELSPEDSKKKAVAKQTDDIKKRAGVEEADDESVEEDGEEVIGVNSLKPSTADNKRIIDPYRILGLIRDGKNDMAVKYWSEVTGDGLKDAKIALEKYIKKYNL